MDRPAGGAGRGAGLGRVARAAGGRGLRRRTRPSEAVRWAQALPLAAIGGLAPAVCAAARSGDPRRRGDRRRRGRPADRHAGRARRAPLGAGRPGRRSARPATPRSATGCWRCSASAGPRPAPPATRPAAPPGWPPGTAARGPAICTRLWSARPPHAMTVRARPVGQLFAPGRSRGCCAGGQGPASTPRPLTAQCSANGASRPPETSPEQGEQTPAAVVKAKVARIAQRPATAALVRDPGRMCQSPKRTGVAHGTIQSAPRNAASSTATVASGTATRAVNSARSGLSR